MEINRVIFNNFNIKENGIKSLKKDLVVSSVNNYNKIASYPPSYYIKNLSFKGEDFKKRLTEEINKSSTDDLFLFLNTELRRRAGEKNIQRQITDDVVQNRIIQIFIIMNEAKNQEEMVDRINRIFEDLKPERQDFHSEYANISLYKTVKYDHHNLSLIDIIPDDEEHRIQSLTSPDEKTVAKQKQRVDFVLSKAQLDSIGEGIIKDKFLQNTPVKYKNISDKYNICEQTAMLLLKRAFLKIQIANDSLPQETRKKIEDLSKILNTDYNSAQKAVLNNPYILNHSTEELQGRVKDVVEAFKDNGLTYEQYSVCCVKHPQLLNKSAQGIEKNIRGVIEKFKDNDLSLNNYIKDCIKQPSLFYQSPNNIEKKINSLVKKFENNGLTVNSYLNACIKYPALFGSSPETIEKNIKGTVDIFLQNGLTIDKYIKAACKAASLFATPPKTVEANVKGLVEKFKNNGLTVDKYIKACVKNPPLFYQSPDTIENNIKGLVEKYKDNGLTIDDYVKSACKSPTLFCLLPTTVEKNIKNVVNEYKDNGITTDKYIKACVKNPPLFYHSVDNIKNNVNELVKVFKNNSLTTNEYIHCCLKQPTLFNLSPERIEYNVKGLVNKYVDKGLTVDDYIKTCKTSPSLFQSSPDTISEHIDVQRFSFFNTNKNMDDEQAMRKILSNGIDLSCSSKLLLIKNLILPKIFEKNTKPKGLMRGGHLEEKLENYLKNNPDKTYEINVKEYNTETDCVKLLKDYLKELSQKTLGKDNVFTINIQK